MQLGSISEVLHHNIVHTGVLLSPGRVNRIPPGAFASSVGEHCGTEYWLQAVPQAWSCELYLQHVCCLQACLSQIYCIRLYLTQWPGCACLLGQSVLSSAFCCSHTFMSVLTCPWTTAQLRFSATACESSAYGTSNGSLPARPAVPLVDRIGKSVQAHTSFMPWRLLCLR